MEIRNCKFEYECPEKWESLVKTEQQNVRYCNICDKGVHFCKNEKEIFELIKDNKCIAIEVSDTPEMVMMGSMINI
ncbi:hypothetical protein [Psychrosphaera algicola]|uniref:Uncharacterized protein n=1 Tax=Psychrosphaera algicola TaxID=3023714 RepID=A0ABT5FIM1_9GAMM|nr:hypothetical protein [Psychrosphaera sp. G1-22]MDC2891036.1 hypothetical protein [Psychrosphaera sp. G1-22]